MIADIKPQVPVNAAALNKINLLGVTNSWAFHRQGSAIGFGIITIWELGMICGHSRDFPPTCREKQTSVSSRTTTRKREEREGRVSGWREYTYPDSESVDEVRCSTQTKDRVW